MNIPLSTHLCSCERHSKLSIVLSLMIFFLFKLETALPQACSFQPVACPINSAPSPTKFNTACPLPSALSFIKPVIASLQLLATDSHWECELEHSIDMISPFPESYFFSVLGQVDGVCLLRQNDLPEVDGTSACSRCACVRACTITITAEADPVQVSPWRRLSFGSRVQRPCSNPSVSKSIPIQSEINKTSWKYLGGFRVSISPDERAVRSTAKKLRSCHPPPRIDHPSNIYASYRTYHAKPRPRTSTNTAQRIRKVFFPISFSQTPIGEHPLRFAPNWFDDVMMTMCNGTISPRAEGPKRKIP